MDIKFGIIKRGLRIILGNKVLGFGYHEAIDVIKTLQLYIAIAVIHIYKLAG